MPWKPEKVARTKVTIFIVNAGHKPKIVEMLNCTVATGLVFV